ncbi:bifunctional phosphopantothenoylcysteine decarboxylase/phosphopantothenate--cysteine ligase CoaBC [Congregibacter litoralis]|uniref:Coenzyme A biosynthesis bifunctional protein CoaBC n=1 Tax=Congregibacter litoralis KT71 TaxID=314285 RepID=A4A9B5_9GAMM|nr:bifunctional phosphopantothenoylcysteine decarboxylase/phosphopantothenate--cysteine ligase CoaBC [Congregibacter litoralis]EAQ97657.1 Phosphopantothenate-cysteine ligase/Phosphopantothenoylcysteine decarboxylase [Congregibacter litoralis KT71]
MGHLNNRRVLLAVCGGIAAYKSAELVRKLQDDGAEVRVIMTRGAQEFITPLTLQALSGHSVHHSLLDEEAERGMGHIELARWADLMIVAPATADCMARLAAGRADDLLTTVALATAAPMLLAPAMNQQMWKDPATQSNLATLTERGMHFAGPDSGNQACGDVGPGRLLDPPLIIEHAQSLFQSGVLAGQRVVITAGPTREPLDPVRYISNHSSGKMGYALARAAVEAGASVDLISGPVALSAPDRVKLHRIGTAQEMLEASLGLLHNCDIFIGCAAVADYRPADAAVQKIKKSADEVSLQLVKNPDVLARVAGHSPKPFSVGFAAETEKLREHALGKLERKGLNMIVANDVSDSRIGFNSENNAALLLWRDDAGVREREVEQCSKDVLAAVVIAQIASLKG